MRSRARDLDHPGSFRVVFQSITQNGRILSVVHRGASYSVKLLRSGQVSIMGPQGAKNIPPKLVEGVKELVQNGRGFAALYTEGVKAAQPASTIAGKILFRGPW